MQRLFSTEEETKEGGKEMKPCVMCGKEFEEKDLDFLGRCAPCFRDFMDTPEDKRPKLGKPFVPIYHGGR